MVYYGFIRCPFSWLGIKPANLFFAGSKETFNKYFGPIDNTTEILWMHTMDYDIYLKQRNKNFTEQPIAIFLDDYIPFHPDFIAQGMPFPFPADNYYQMLNRFFKLVEDQLGLEVIIAAHPRSNYETHPDYFEKHKCLKGQTFKLIRESRFVMAHGSTALALANLFYKPVILLTSSELDNTDLASHIRIMAKWFGKKPIHMDKLDENHEIDWKQELAVDKDCYDLYRQSYIKAKESLDYPQGQILIDRLKKGLAK